MATNVIKWFPVLTPNIVGYEIQYSDTGANGEFLVGATVLHTIPGTYWNEAEGVFQYTEDAPVYRYYKLITLDRFGNRGEDEVPVPFKAGNDPITAPNPFRTPLDQDSGGPQSMTYVTQDGQPVVGATIRIYEKPAYDAGNLDNVIGITVTTETGGWKDQIQVQPGQTYTVIFHKPNEYGPDRAEITV